MGRPMEVRKLATESVETELCLIQSVIFIGV